VRAEKIKSIRPTMTGMKTRFWKRAFPEVFETRLTRTDLEMCPDFDYSRTSVASDCFIRIERARRGSAIKRIAERFNESLTKKERWNLLPASHYGLLWSSADTTQEPIGIVAFKIGLTETARSGRLAGVYFELVLILIHPEYRGRGYGSYMACGVTSWLDACRVNDDRCARRGVEVTFFADYITEGGEACSQILISHFKFLRELRLERSETDLGWHIYDVSVDAGF
jgi:GNAT superfamily N-acetyltransferase